jgi:hypothetical protein
LPAAVINGLVIARRLPMITIGIDPHKASHTAVALDEDGRLLGEVRVVAAKAMLERLLHWAELWPERIWAVEGASGCECQAKRGPP